MKRLRGGEGKYLPRNLLTGTRKDPESGEGEAGEQRMRGTDDIVHLEWDKARTVPMGPTRAWRQAVQVWDTPQKPIAISIQIGDERVSPSS